MAGQVKNCYESLGVLLRLVGIKFKFNGTEIRQNIASFITYFSGFA